ncbi:Autoinducer 2 sensor kinase/phosphatase LuxQ [compost metagenome]
MATTTGLNKNKIWRNIVIVVLFILALTGARVLWMMSFQSVGQPHAIHGQLDLRDWNIAEGRPITLDGQWEFYSHAWLEGHEDGRKPPDRSPGYIQVPGSWNDALRPGSSTPYGYGSYRLRILVNLDKDMTYSIRIPSVRSSSELYVNGRLLAGSGQPAEKKDEYTAGNVPYSASFTADSSGEIEVVVQVANYKDPRQSGIARSMKFGTESAMDKETQLSVTMQQLVAVVFALHALYALIMFLIGNREKKLLLYFSLLALSAMFIILLGSDEKLLSYWAPINYEWGFKLVHLSMIAVAYSLLQCVSDQLAAFWRKCFPGFAVLCGGATLAALFLSTQVMVTIQPLYVLITGTSVVVTMVTIFRSSVKQLQDNLLLLLSLVAFASNFMWWGIFLITGIKTVYYPFDLIVSTGCLASVWFGRYFQILVETRGLAAKLQRADKLKDEFLANTSHELRNPLHGILNISQAVLERERSSLNEESIKDLEIVLSVGRRMSLTLNDLLDMMSLKESSPRLQYRSFSIHTIATGVIDMLRYMTEGKPVVLINEIPADFLPVYADENRVIQIVFNLLHNAVKYTNEGQVSIKANVKGNRAQIMISDTGIGMDEDTIRRVFEPYEQAHSDDAAMSEGGFGLGLSISRQLVELHGGRLQASSVPGQGSSFVFSLQISDQTDVRKEAESEAIASIAYAAPTWDGSTAPLDMISEQPPQRHEDRPLILVVDDDPVNLKVLETILILDRYDIMTVTEGRRAMEALDLKEWDLVISDVMMPHMSGYELSRRIRQRFAITELPILLLTARSQPEDIENGFRAGANDYVMKPVDALELRSRVKALTDVKQSARDRLRMEAAWLQAQIQPHFIFNTLNAIAALSEIDIDRMRNLLEVFADFLRHKVMLQNMDEPVPIEDELHIVRSYLFIEQERFEERLQVEWDIDECNQLTIPLLTIQPLVENAVRHGIMKRARGGKLTIRVSNYNTYVKVSVEDDGVGMDEGTLQRVWDQGSDYTSGVGLRNTDLRLKRFYGQGLQITSEPGRGTTVSFVVYTNS